MPTNTTGRKTATKSAAKTTGRTRSTAAKSNGKPTATKTKVKAQSEIVFRIKHERDPKGSGGVRFGEVEVKDQPMVLGKPYITQDALALLGNDKEYEVVIRRVK